MRILYVTTISATMGFFKKEFIHLQQNGHIIELACNCNNAFGFDIPNTDMIVYNLPFSRSPFSPDNLFAYRRLKKLVNENHYDIVHCHTPNAAAITRLACRNIRSNGTKVIYTAHGFHFYAGSPKKNWMIFYPIERLCARWTDVLLTINSEDFKLAKSKFKAKKIDYIPGVGIDLAKFSAVTVDIMKKRRELDIPSEAFVLLSVGELNENKNHETVIRAIAGIKDVYYLIAGMGNKEERLRRVIKEFGINDRVKILGFRNDIPELLAIANAFIFPAFREGLSVSLMEAMASGKPAIVSKIRGNIDLIDENGGLLFDPYSIDDCRKAIEALMNSNISKMGNYNQNKIKRFSDIEVLKKIDEIYTIN